MRTSRMMAASVAVVGALTLAACSGTGTSDDAKVDTDVEFDAGTTMAELHEAGTITIGTKFDQPLFGQVGPDGDPVGFDVEIGKIIAAELGIPASKIKWVETVSANREPFIQNGEIDLAIATYTINDERKKVVSFAGPYYVAGQDLLVPAGNPKGIQGPEDVKGLTVCSVTGSTSALNIEEYEPKEVLTTDTYSACVEPVRTGAADALTTDNTVLAGIAAQNEGEFEIVGKPFTEEPYGIGLAKDDTEFRDFVNEVLEDAFDDGRWADAWKATAGKVLPLPEAPTIER